MTRPERTGATRMHIRPARIEDCPGMARVIVDTFLQSNRDLLPEEVLRKRAQEWTYDVSARNWEQALREIDDGSAPRDCVFVAVDESGEVVGLAMGVPSATDSGAGEVDVLYVRASHQQQGIGRALVQAVATRLAVFGMTTIHIATPAASTPARRFYEALGGTLVGTREDVDDGIAIPLVVYGWADSSALTARPSA